MTGRSPGAVLFDLDGTLVDTSSLWQAAYTALADDLGVTLPGDWWATVRGRSLTTSLAVFGPAVADGGTSRPDEVVDLEAALVAQAEKRLGSIPVTWLPGARALLQAVDEAGMDAAVVTSTWRGLTEAILAADDVAVSTVVGGDEVTHGKPAPDIYLRAASRLGVAPARCLAVEDSPTGVAAAEAAGMTVLVAPSAAPIAPAPGRTLVRSLAEVGVDDLGALLS